MAKAGQDLEQKNRAQQDDVTRRLHVTSLGHVPTERLPLGGIASNFHSLQVHRQVSTWSPLETVLSKEVFRFMVPGGAMVPVIQAWFPYYQNFYKRLGREVPHAATTASKYIRQWENRPPALQDTDITQKEV